ALATLLEFDRPRPAPVVAAPAVPVPALEVVAAVPIGGLIRLSVPPVAEPAPWPTCVAVEPELPRPMPAELLVVPPVLWVVELAAPPSRPEFDAAVAPVVFVLNEFAVNAPSAALDCETPVTADCEEALAT